MRDERLYLTDIVEAADAISRFLAGVNEEEWSEDEMRQSATMHQLVVIGEAASRLSRRFREAYPEITWPDIIGFRNLAVHAYFAVSWPIVWVTATEDVPALREQIARILTMCLRTIDFSPQRLGQCYDSFWDRHPDNSPIVATSFTDFLERLLVVGGKHYYYWDLAGFKSLGAPYGLGRQLR